MGTDVVARFAASTAGLPPTAAILASALTGSHSMVPLERGCQRTDSSPKARRAGKSTASLRVIRGSRGSDPRLLRLTMDGLLDRTVGSDPEHQGSSAS